MAKLCVLGLGYIGLPTAAMLATSGLQVVGMDINEFIPYGRASESGKVRPRSVKAKDA